EALEHANGNNRVVYLMTPFELDLDRPVISTRRAKTNGLSSVKGCRQCLNAHAIVGENQGRLPLISDVANDTSGFRFQLSYHDWHTALDDPAFFSRNLGQSVTQVLLVIEGNRRDGRHHGK